MRISRQTQEADLLALLGWLQIRPEGLRHRRLAYIAHFAMTSLGVYLLLFALYIKRFHFNPWWVLAPAVPLGLAIWHPMWMWLERRAGRAFVDANQKELGLQEFWVDADGFGNGTPAGTTYHRWHTVGEVHPTEDFTAVIAAARLYTIPAGTDREEYARFVDELRRCREAAAPARPS